MNRREFLATPAVLMQPAAARPNVVILLADDLGWRDTGFHDSEIRTPNLDRLRSQSVEIKQFYSFPLCSPTRTGLMTGRNPIRVGVGYNVIRPWMKIGVPLEEHLMPQSFRAAGYQTAITGKWHLGHARKEFLPNARGFDHAYGHVNGAIDYNTHMRDGGLDWHRNGKSVREDGYTTGLLAAEAIRFIRSRDRARPFFLYMPFNAPHTPLQAPPERLDKYASIADKTRRTFAAMVDALDDSIGKVLAALDSEGIANNTIVLFFSDNGGPTNVGARNEPLRGAKSSCWEGGIRVPALLRWPGKLKAGSETRQVMTMSDVFPTLAAAAGVTTRNKLPFDGRNLWPSLSTGKVEVREDLFWGVENQVFAYALRRGPWKLVRQISKTGEIVSSALFQIEDDPNEQHDLSAKRQDLVKELGASLEQWRKVHPANGLRASGTAPAGWKAPDQYVEAAQ
ncbi:MAG: arylsulfatase [Candidatus Solibacter usitatus]|nr:arylsulfatase [Candidatus Solibacter usitatus]